MAESKQTPPEQPPHAKQSAGGSRGANELPYDLLIIGGGINGAGIASHAARAGWRTMLVEQDDWAQATSSSSSKMIHGGLRYLENREFRLVRESLGERTVLMRMAPHLIHPLRLVIPHRPEMRPMWMIRLGLFLYDYLASRPVQGIDDSLRQTKLPRSTSLDLSRHEAGKPLHGSYPRGFAYSDCQVDDARLVIANVQDCQRQGGVVRPRTRFLRAERRHGREWVAELEDTITRQPLRVHTRAIVNASGPWVEKVLQQLHLHTRDTMRLVKGSHIVVPRLYPGEHAYLLQHSDRRVVFVIPYQQNFSLIGTTELLHHDDPAQVECSDQEVRYLCNLVGEYLQIAPNPEQVCWRYAGLRPLYDDHQDALSKVTRDYVLRMDEQGAPVLSVFGGKLTTYRQLALQVIQRLAATLGPPPRGAQPPVPLPGGNLPEGNFSAFLAVQQIRYPLLPPPLVRRLASQYGSLLPQMLGDRQPNASAPSPLTVDDLGEHFGAGLYEREVRYLMEHEWARQPEDILWRRTKLGLQLDAAASARLAAWLAKADSNLKRNT